MSKHFEAENPEVFSMVCDLNESDAEALFTYLHGQNALSLKAKIVLTGLFVVLPAIIAGAGMIGVFRTTNGVLPFVFLGGVSTLFGFILWRNRSPRAKARATINRPDFKNSAADFFQRTEYEVSRRGLSIRTRKTETHYNWDAILGIGKTADYLFFVTAPRVASVVPLRVLESNERRASLVAFCKNRVAGPFVDHEKGDAMQWADVDVKSGELISDHPHCHRCKSVTPDSQLQKTWFLLQPFEGNFRYCSDCRTRVNKNMSLYLVVFLLVLVAVFYLRS